jgi:RNA polymerase sigma-32 factor
MARQRRELPENKAEPTKKKASAEKGASHANARGARVEAPRPARAESGASAEDDSLAPDAVLDAVPGDDKDDDAALESELVEDGALTGEVIDETETEHLPLPPREGSSLARYDALTAYMRDVHRYNVLDADTQRSLAVRYREQGDLDAARQLVTSNLRLVVKIAYDYRRAYRNVMDLIQEGNIGLMQAVKKYDPYKGVKLSSYAAWWIRAYILRFILNNWRLVKLGTTQAQRKLFFNLSKEKARLSALGIEPSAENIAHRLDVSVEDVTSMDRRLSAGEMSLDTPVGNDEGKGQTRVDMMPAVGSRVDELLADEELGQLLHAEMHKFGETLKGKERQIFYERLMAEDPRTLQELGADFGVSRERVRQLEKRLQERLKAYLEEKLGSEVLEP